MSSSGNVLRISIKDSGVGSWNTANPASLSYLGGYFDSFAQVSQMVSGASSGFTDYWAAGRGGLMTMNTASPGAVSVRSNLTRLPIGPSLVRQSAGAGAGQVVIERCALVLTYGGVVTDSGLHQGQQRTAPSKFTPRSTART